MEELKMFKSCSANDENNLHLYIKGASLFIPQLNKLLEHTNYNFNIINIEFFYDDECLKLGKIFQKIQFW